MNLDSIRKIYFIGIGGIGMSALAKYFFNKNLIVSGYDKTQTNITDSLILLGVKIVFKDSNDLIDKDFLDSKDTLVVVTPAIPNSNKILNYFKSSGFKVMKRAEVLGLITNNSKCLAIAGTHGKTTTTAILTHLMFECDQKFTSFIGGISENYNSNFIDNGDEYTIVEADEYDRSFLCLAPDIACITSIDADHLDIYGDESNLNNAFSEFSKLIPSKNKLFIHSNIDFPGISYGVNTSSDYCAQNISIENGVYNFDLKAPNTIFKGLKFSIPGKHNLSNAVAAFAMALESGCNEINLRSALETYKGVKRRFSYKLKTDDLIFIDDYAHHPKEIDVVWEAVNEIYPNKKTTAVFQPHLYSRTKDFADDFAVSLSKFDTVLLLDIYPAREIPIHGVTSTWLLEKITSRRKKLVTKDNLFKAIRAEDNPILITMGAGDIEVEVDKLTKNLLYG
ncbi:MAG: UDP-N-acetylmuramate--L-alanine ligase [Flavobacteriaceae bacterium]